MKSYEPKTYRPAKTADPVVQADNETDSKFVNPPSFNLNEKDQGQGQAIQRTPDEENQDFIVDPNTEGKDSEELDRDDFHQRAAEDPANETAGNTLGDSFYDVIDALFEIDYAEQEREAMLSEIKEVPFGTDINASFLKAQQIKDYLYIELDTASEDDADLDFDYIDQLANSAVDIREIMEIENDLTKARDEQYMISHNEYEFFIRAMERLPEFLAKQQLKEYEDKLAEIKKNLARAESEKNEAYLEAGINIGMDLVGILAISNPWTGLAYGLGSWALSTQYLDDKLGPDLDGATQTSSDIGDDKQFADTVGGTADKLKNPPKPGSPKVGKYGKAGFGFNRVNDGLEIKTAYDNIEKLEKDKDKTEDKIEDQEKTVKYEEEMSRIKKQIRENRNTKKINELQTQIYDNEKLLNDAIASFNKTYEDVTGEI